MQYEGARMRLINHANLPIYVEGRSGDPAESFVYSLYEADNKRIAFDIKTHCESIVECLEELNVALNGGRPSENTDPFRPVDRSLVLAMSSILDAGWSYYWRWTTSELFDREFRERLAQALWVISCAWALALHGDIDALRENIGYEYAALGLGPLTILSAKSGANERHAGTPEGQG